MSFKQMEKQIKKFLEEKKTLLYPKTKEVLSKEVERIKEKKRGK